MMDAANAVEMAGISKKYRIYHDKSTTLKEKMLFWNRGGYSELKVFDDINVNIRRGTMTGIIGRNGSGKSTLLKLITRIIYPDSGSISTYGKIASLLELGVGFHPDFTGRENIYFNASVFGLSKRDIRARFPRIVEFSELEEFIDTPVRKYSTGMYMRLAFSTAIHAEADILLLDEVFAVGDAGFQKKCLDRIAGLKKAGTTILLVTHDTNIVCGMCDEALWLDSGAVRMRGDARAVADAYTANMNKERFENTAGI